MTDPERSATLESPTASPLRSSAAPWCFVVLLAIGALFGCASRAPGATAARSAPRGEPIRDYAIREADVMARDTCDRPDSIYAACGRGRDYCLGHVRGVAAACVEGAPELFPRVVTSENRADTRESLYSCTALLVVEVLAQEGCDAARASSGSSADSKTR